MRLRVDHLAGGRFVAGATLGFSVQARAIAAIGTLTDATIYLDFDGIEAATSSFLREAVLGLRDFCHRSSRSLALVVANPSELVTEELGDYLTRRRDIVLCCRLDSSGTPADPFLLGLLEDAQRRTLRAVLEIGATDATTLAALPSPDDYDRIGTTGWNNRLASLAAKGILRETRRGRSKTYRPAVEGLTLVR